MVVLENGGDTITQSAKSAIGMTTERGYTEKFCYLVYYINRKVTLHSARAKELRVRTPHYRSARKHRRRLGLRQARQLPVPWTDSHVPQLSGPEHANPETEH